jgi:N-methylhydantoinase B
MNLPIEAAEASMPVRFIAYRLMQASGGEGAHRGGAGVLKSIEFLADGIEASVLGERTLSPPHGVAGGNEGKLASFTLQRVRGERRALGAKSGPHKLAAGDRLEMITAGGGGWGKKKS